MFSHIKKHLRGNFMITGVMYDREVVLLYLEFNLFLNLYFTNMPVVVGRQSFTKKYHGGVM